MSSVHPPFTPGGWRYSRRPRHSGDIRGKQFFASFRSQREPRENGHVGRTEGGRASVQVSTAGRAESYCEVAAGSVQRVPPPPCVVCILSSITTGRSFVWLRCRLSLVSPTRGSCFSSQMVSELKEQNGLLKTEKDDLNRLIQEQSQQMTGEGGRVGGRAALLKLTIQLSRSPKVPSGLTSRVALLPPQRKWLVPSCRRRSSWTRS